MNALRLDDLKFALGWIHIVGRLRPGETPSVAAARLNALNPLGLTGGQVSHAPRTSKRSFSGGLIR